MSHRLASIDDLAAPGGNDEIRSFFPGEGHQAIDFVVTAFAVEQFLDTTEILCLEAGLDRLSTGREGSLATRDQGLRA